MYTLSQSAVNIITDFHLQMLTTPFMESRILEKKFELSLKNLSSDFSGSPKESNVGSPASKTSRSGPCGLSDGSSETKEKEKIVLPTQDPRDRQAFYDRVESFNISFVQYS